MFLQTVCRHLDERRLVTTEVHVRGPEYVDIGMVVGFDPAPGMDLPDVREAVKAAVRAFLSPLDVSRRFLASGWPLGKAVDPMGDPHRGGVGPGGVPRQRREAGARRR